MATRPPRSWARTLTFSGLAPLSNWRTPSKPWRRLPTWKALNKGRGRRDHGRGESRQPMSSPGSLHVCAHSQRSADDGQLGAGTVSGEKRSPGEARADVTRRVLLVAGGLTLLVGCASDPARRSEEHTS